MMEKKVKKETKYEMEYPIVNASRPKQEVKILGEYEAINRTIKEGATAMLSEAKLPASFCWFYMNRHLPRHQYFAHGY